MMQAEMPAGRGPRLLVINPNSNEAITAQVRLLAGRVLGPDARVRVADLPGAPQAIQSPADRAVAEPLAVARIEAALAEGVDAVALACFDDITIAARGRLRVPVVDAVEASLALARSRGGRFTIVTTFEAAVPRIRALVARHGLEQLGHVRAAGIGVSAAAALSPETLARLRETIEAAIREDGAEAIILGSGGLAGRGAVLSSGLTGGGHVRIIDSIEAAIRQAQAAASIRPKS